MRILALILITSLLSACFSTPEPLIRNDSSQIFPVRSYFYDRNENGGLQFQATNGGYSQISPTQAASREPNISIHLSLALPSDYYVIQDYGNGSETLYALIKIDRPFWPSGRTEVTYYSYQTGAMHFLAEQLGIEGISPTADKLHPLNLRSLDLMFREVIESRDEMLQMNILTETIFELYDLTDQDDLSEIQSLVGRSKIVD